MAVYEGALRRLSSGPFHGRWSVREFIDIGEHHLRNVALTEYHAQLLGDALGEHVAVSTVGARGMRPGKKTVMAIRTPERGIVKASSSTSFFFTALFQTLLTWVAGIIAIFFVWGFAELLDAGDSTIATALGIGVAALFFFGPLVSAVRVSLARGALSPAPVSRPDPAAAPAGAAVDPTVTAATVPSAPHSGVVVAAAAPEPSPDSAPSTTRFCENCGAARRPGGNFCPSCGHA